MLLLDRINNEILSRKEGDPIRPSMLLVKQKAYKLQTQEDPLTRDEALLRALEEVAKDADPIATLYLRTHYVPIVEWATDAEILSLLHAYQHTPLGQKVRSITKRLKPKKVRLKDINRLLKSF